MNDEHQTSNAGLCFWKGKQAGGSLGKVGSGHLAQYYYHMLLARLKYGKGRKGRHKCWKQSLDCQQAVATLLLNKLSTAHWQKATAPPRSTQCLLPSEAPLVRSARSRFLYGDLTIILPTIISNKEH